MHEHGYTHPPGGRAYRVQQYHFFDKMVDTDRRVYQIKRIRIHVKSKDKTCAVKGGVCGGPSVPLYDLELTAAPVKGQGISTRNLLSVPEVKAQSPDNLCCDL